MSYVLHTKITTDADTGGIDKYDKRLKQVEKTGQSLGDTLKSIGKGLLVGASITGVITMAETYGEMSGLLTSTAGRMGKSLSEMQSIVKETASAVSEDAFTIAKLYSSATLAVQSFGGDMKLADGITKSLSASLKLSGTTASKTTMVLEQAAKMFASGEVNSRGFLSLAVEAPVLLDKLSKEFGMSAKEMKVALENETISMEKLLTTVSGFSDELVAGVQTGPMNFSHFMSQIKNEFMYFFGEIEEGTRILSATFKGIVYILRSITGTVRFLVKVLGGWNNALKVFIGLLFFLKRDVIFLKAQQLASYFRKISVGAFTAGKGIVGFSRGLFTAKAAMSAFWAAASLGASVGVALLFEEILAMAEGRPNLIGFCIFIMKDHVTNFLDFLSRGLQACINGIMTLIQPLLKSFSYLWGGIKSIGGWFGGKRGSLATPESPVPRMNPQTDNQSTNKSNIVNNNQTVKIEINGGDDPALIKQAVIEGVSQGTSLQQLNTDKLEQRTKTR